MLLVHTVLVLEHYSKDFFLALWQETEIEIKHFKANNDKIMNELVPGIEPRPPTWEVSMLTVTPRRFYINEYWFVDLFQVNAKLMWSIEKNVTQPCYSTYYWPVFRKMEISTQIFNVQRLWPSYCVTKSIYNGGGGS